MTTLSLSVVAVAPLLAVANSLPNGNIGGPYDAVLTATGGKAPYTWTVAAGALPTGLTLVSTTGTITGTVTDPSGGAVPGVTLTIKSTVTGLTETRTTTATGTYSVISLEPGEYVVSFHAKGFRSGKMNVTVPVGVVANGDFRLELGSETTMVTVEGAGAPLVSTAQATVQDVMTSKEIDTLPLHYHRPAAYLRVYRGNVLAHHANEHQLDTREEEKSNDDGLRAGRCCLPRHQCKQEGEERIEEREAGNAES